MDIVFANDGQIGFATLARPQSLNALTLSMIHALHHQLTRWQEDNSIHAVIIKADSGKAFCAGGDVRWLYEAGRKQDSAQMQFFRDEYRLNDAIHQFKKPYIALMDGITMGGGVGISLHGSYPVATEKFTFAMPETGIGLFPDIGASYLLARCPGAVGVYLGLTGNRISGADALAIGLVKHYVSSECLSQLIENLKNTDLSVNTIQQISSCLNYYAIADTDSQLRKDMEKINHFFAKNSVIEIMEELKNSSDPWAVKTLEILQQKSPLSMAVTFKQITDAQSLSLTQCLEVDYCLVEHFMAGHDFYEGVRALLVDKDKTPHWKPEFLDASTIKMAEKYFT